MVFNFQGQTLIFVFLGPGSLRALLNISELRQMCIVKHAVGSEQAKSVKRV